MEWKFQGEEGAYIAIGTEKYALKMRSHQPLIAKLLHKVGMYTASLRFGATPVSARPTRA